MESEVHSSPEKIYSEENRILESPVKIEVQEQDITEESRIKLDFIESGEVSLDIQDIPVSKSPARSKHGPEEEEIKINFSDRELELPEFEKHPKSADPSDLNHDFPLEIRKTKSQGPSTKNSLPSKAVLVLGKLAEMGYTPDEEVVVKVILSHPENTSLDMLIEMIIFRIENPELNQISEEDADDLSDLDQNLFDILQARGVFASTSCRNCFQSSLDLDFFFDCTHNFCHICMRASVDRIIKDRSQITQNMKPFAEEFECPIKPCKGKIRKNVLITAFPDVEKHFINEPEDPNAVFKTCNICYNDVKDNFFYPIFGCEHEYCKKCTVDFMSENIYSRKVLNIQCPECQSPLDETKIDKVLDKALVDKFHKFKKNAIVDSDPNLRWCCKPGCGQFVTGSKEEPKAHCSTCNWDTCFLCGNKWHDGKSCDQAIEKDYKEFASKNGVDLCPKCKSRIIKDSGCNHMTCPICRYQWCWLCGGTYSPNHYSKLNIFGCPGLQSGILTLIL